MDSATMSPGGLVTAALHRDVSMLGDSLKEALVPCCSEGWGPACKQRGDNDIDCKWETASLGNIWVWEMENSQGRQHFFFGFVYSALFKFRGNVSVSRMWCINSYNSYSYGSWLVLFSESTITNKEIS